VGDPPAAWALQAVGLGAGDATIHQNQVPMVQQQVLGGEQT